MAMNHSVGTGCLFGWDRVSLVALIILGVTLGVSRSILGVEHLLCSLSLH